ncbi:hypothetical protein STEG23_006779 [Scotinomys teguina]
MVAAHCWRGCSLLGQGHEASVDLPVESGSSRMIRLWEITLDALQIFSPWRGFPVLLLQDPAEQPGFPTTPRSNQKAWGLPASCSPPLHLCGRLLKRPNRCLQNPEEGTRSTGTEVTDTCELPLWVLRFEPGSSGRAVSALNHRAIISPALFLSCSARPCSPCSDEQTPIKP